ncbi:MAG: hypothetical protein C0594_14310 [Marinilabiliales bacterium]|nr:MAG: hypothetical protein C0594_14310 [Marinilabiliales bacterium]
MDLIQHYQQKIDSCNQNLLSINKKLKRNAWLRSFSFIGFTTGIYFSVSLDNPYILTTAIPFILLFVPLYKHTHKLNKQKAYFETLHQLNKNELESQKGNFSNFYPGNEFTDRNHAFAYDMDLFGEKSLYQYINRSGTLSGKALLAYQMKNPLVDMEKIQQKQKAVSKLKENHAWIQHFLVKCHLIKESEIAKNEVIQWIQSKSQTISKYINIIRYLLPTLTWITILLAIFTNINPYLILIPLILSWLTSSSFLNKINKEYQKISEQNNYLSNYADVISEILNTEIDAEYIHMIKLKLEDKLRADIRLKKLSKLMALFEYRNNLIVGLILNSLLLWDFHIVYAIEKWKKNNTNMLDKWFETIGLMEAICSFSNFSFNHPTYVFAEYSEGNILDVEEIGHPLIAGQCITNSVTIQSKNDYQIITGANMAGKSTYLRTLGVNLVLAMNGSVVFAKEFTFKPAKIFSSMRTSDNLMDNESYFYAELNRLKKMLKYIDDNDFTFVILDEILKGTNSEDKKKGSAIILKKLLQTNSCGVIATHDLDLTEMDKKFPNQISNYHFNIDLEGDQMIFSYKLSPGVADKMNAILLMQEMGLIDKAE